MPETMDSSAYAHISPRPFRWRAPGDFEAPWGFSPMTDGQVMGPGILLAPADLPMPTALREPFCHRLVASSAWIPIGVSGSRGRSNPLPAQRDRPAPRPASSWLTQDGGGIDSLWYCLPPHGSPVPSMRNTRGSLLATRPEKPEHPVSSVYQGKIRGYQDVHL